MDVGRDILDALSQPLRALADPGERIFWLFLASAIVLPWLLNCPKDVVLGACCAVASNGGEARTASITGSVKVVPLFPVNFTRTPSLSTSIGMRSGLWASGQPVRM